VPASWRWPSSSCCGCDRRPLITTAPVRQSSALGLARMSRSHRRRGFSPGPIRYSFLVCEGRVLPEARRTSGSRLRRKPYQRGPLRARDDRDPRNDTSQSDDLRRAFALPRRGHTTWHTAGRAVRGLGNVACSSTVFAAVGRRPVAAPHAGNDWRQPAATTATHPLWALHASRPGAGGHEPFVVTARQFCTSRIWTPVVDALPRAEAAPPAVRFIHVEVFGANDPARYNRWMREWGRRASRGSPSARRAHKAKFAARFAGSCLPRCTR
jgi:hypothetical protein